MSDPVVISPIRGLEASGQGSPDTGTSAYPNTTSVECGSVGYTCELKEALRLAEYRGLIEDGAAYLELTGPKGTWRVVDETAGEIAL
jgi:predicted DNA-binding protein (UPF0251 family)